MPIQSQSGSDFLIHWLPCFILLMITNQALGRGYYRFLEVEEYNILKMFTFIKASFSLFSSKRMTFKVTPKSVESSIKSKEKHEVYLHSIILVIILLSIIFGIVNLSRGMFLNYSSTIATVIAILLSLLNSYLLLMTIREVYKRIYFRHDYRFNVKLDSRVVELTGNQLYATVNDISRSGIGLTNIDENIIDNESEIRVCLPDGVFDIKGFVEYNRLSTDGSKNIGLKFDNLSTDQRMRLFYFIYVTVPRYIYNSTSTINREIEYYPDDGSHYEIVTSCNFELGREQIHT